MLWGVKRQGPSRAGAGGEGVSRHCLQGPVPPQCMGVPEVLMCEKIGGLNNGIPSRWPSCLRSIPAHAGEPTGLTPDNQRLRVYPRPRGGTSSYYSRSSSCCGLSPPTRGNRRHQAGCWACTRSIPAHAGEPQSDISSRMLAGGGAYRSRMPGAVQFLGPVER